MPNRSTRAKRTAEESQNKSVSPERKRPSLGEKTMEQRRAEQQQKLAAFREKKRLENEEKKNARPAWRPGGVGVKTRSMTRHYSSPAMLPTPQRKGKAKPKLPTPTQNVAPSSSVAKDAIAEMDESPPKVSSTPMANVKSVPKLSDEPRITPVASRLQLIDIEADRVVQPDPIQLFNVQNDDSDEYNLRHWKKIYEEHVDKLKACQKKLELLSSSQDEFWEVECERARGEVVLFLGKKSKFTQFGRMIDDPHGDKFKVKSEDDILCFWDGMVAPSVNDFLARADWLSNASQNNWPEAAKEAKPGQKTATSPPRAKIQKENRQPAESKTTAAQDEKKLKVRKEAEERRKKMKAMMAAKKKAMSTTNLPNDVVM